MNKAVAIANNDTVFLSWVYDDKIADCLGFAVNRTELGRAEYATASLGRIQRRQQP